MSLSISTSTISKLNHEIKEIRIRALKHIEAKIVRHLNQEEEIIFNAGILMKQLIRWFGQKPLCEEECALNIMIKLLKSQYINEIVSYLGLQRLKKEIDKIFYLCQSAVCRAFIYEMQQVLEGYVEPGVPIDLAKDDVDTIDLCSIADVLNELTYELEEPWSSPSVTDYSSLKLLGDSLQMCCSKDDLEHAFKYLKNALSDYPAEYFLQPPNLFHKMCKLYKKEKTVRITLLQNLKILSKSLAGRLKMKKLSKAYCPIEAKKGTIKPKCQITISNYCNELLNICIENIKDLNADGEQEIVVASYELVFVVIDLIECDPNINLSLSSFLVDFGVLAKYFRQTIRIEHIPNRSLRTHYVIVMHILGRLTLCSFSDLEEYEKHPLSSGNKYHRHDCFIKSARTACSHPSSIVEQTGWMNELETASLDYNLREFYPEIYDIVNKAKAAFKKVKDDTVEIILESEKWLEPAVELLRQRKPLSDVEYICTAVRVTETLHVHRSTDFVEKLMKTIARCMPLFDGNPRLKLAAQSNVLQLLSHDDLKIKKLAYKLSTENMKDLFGGLMSGENTLKKGYGKELSTAKTFGIPLTSEILTEIICFGYTNSDPMAFKKVKDDTVEIILESEKWLEPAVELLRQRKPLSDVEYICTAVRVTETLHVHRSTDFVEKLMKTIARCMPLFDGNPRLKLAAQSNVLQLLSHDDLKIKKLAYKLSTENMKDLFGGLMSGENTLKKGYGKELSTAKTFGIPLTSEILTEIICFGYTNSDPMIHSNAETMLCLILKAKPLLGNIWENILEVVLPNTPLIQCVATHSTELGKLILDFFDPDNDIPLIDIIQGNIRFLFSKDKLIRKESLSRLNFILSMHSESHIYLPNITQIIDTVPADICILQTPKDVENYFCEGLYEESTIHTLLQLIKAPDAEPSIRKTALMQLNIICQDPKLNQKIHDENGWFPVLQILENCLKQTSTADFTDAAIPCVGIILKIIVCNPRFRREISSELYLYFYITRTLLLFYSDTICQQDCSIALFLLSFSSFAVGSRHITLPSICSKLKLPLKCDLHWNDSPFKKISEFEEVYLTMIKGECNTNTHNYNLPDSSRSTCSRGFTILDQFDKVRNSRFSVAEEVALEYIRFCFSKLWFGCMDSFLKMTKKMKDTDGIDYAVLPGKLYQNEGNDIEIFETFNFSEKLKLSKRDLKIVEYSSAQNNIIYFVRQIANSTTQLDVVYGATNLRLILLICSRENLKSKIILNSLKKFLIIPPHSELDQLLFRNVVDLANQFILKGEKSLFLWFLNDFLKSNCMFVNYLKNTDIALDIYLIVANLLKNWIKTFVHVVDSPSLVMEYELLDKNIDKNKLEIFNKLFETLFAVVQEHFRGKRLEHVRPILSILQTVSSSRAVGLDLGFTHEVIKNLMKIIVALKSYTEAGSHIYKNCLYIIGNIMDGVDELQLSSGCLHYLSGLCGHMDLEIRALSWSMLEKVSKYFKGAQSLVTELSFLPGGFHACCLSTFLDVTEASIVRTIAGQILANLLQYTNNSELDISVAPLCIESEPSIDHSGFSLVTEILSKYRLYDRVHIALESFYVSEIILTDLHCEITTCEFVRTFCSIMTNFIDINPDIVMELREKPVFIRIFDLIKTVPACITSSSLDMTAGICNLLTRFILYDSNFLERVIIEGLEVLVVLIHLLDLRLYENSSKSPLLSIIHVLQVLVNNTSAFENISKTFLVIDIGKIISVLIYGINYSGCKDLEQMCLQFLSACLIKSQSETFNFDTVADLIENVELQNVSSVEKYPIFQRKENRSPSLDSLNKNIEAGIQETNGNDYSESVQYYGSTLLFRSIEAIFKKLFQSEKSDYTMIGIKRKTRICESLAILLKISSKAKATAKNDRFLGSLIIRFNSILKEMGTSCADFLRKTNDSKKSVMIEELIILLGIISNWYSSVCLVEDDNILQLTKIFINIWPLLGYSPEFRINFLNCLAFLSEHSIPVCKYFSSSGTPQTILQLVGNLSVSETTKIKQPPNETGSLRILLRIVSNCCSCIEGRLLIIKLNLLDVINRFHPSVTKFQKAWNPFIILWLKMWEIFSRHSEGAGVKHLYLLCNLIAKATPEIRIICLSIIRNMAFLPANKPALLASDDFKYTVQSTLKEGKPEEQLIVCAAIWKIVAGHFRAKHAIKKTTVPKTLQTLLHKLNEKGTKSECENELTTVVEVLLKILYE